MTRLLLILPGLLAASWLFAGDTGMAPASADGSVLHGEPMPLGKPLAIGVAIDQADHWLVRPGKFQGRITSVCQNRGCWLVLADGERHARVFTGHRFFLPKDAAGRAVVHGRLSRATLSEDFARHLAEDAGEDPDAVRGEQEEYRIDATSIQILPAS